MLFPRKIHHREEGEIYLLTDLGFYSFLIYFYEISAENKERKLCAWLSRLFYYSFSHFHNFLVFPINNFFRSLKY